MLTAGIEALPLEVQMPVLGRVMIFSDFTPDNDPHGEHDFGTFEVAGRKFFFKIDYYDLEPRVRLGRSGRSGEDNPRADDHARHGVLSMHDNRSRIYALDSWTVEKSAAAGSSSEPIRPTIGAARTTPR